MRNFIDLFQTLPKNLQAEVVDFIEFLDKKNAQKSKSGFTFAWAGALKSYKDQYSSVELQKQAMKWF